MYVILMILLDFILVIYEYIVRISEEKKVSSRWQQYSDRVVKDIFRIQFSNVLLLLFSWIFPVLNCHLSFKKKKIAFKSAVNQVPMLYHLFYSTFFIEMRRST